MPTLWRRQVQNRRFRSHHRPCQPRQFRQLHHSHADCHLASLLPLARNQMEPRPPRRPRKPGGPPRQLGARGAAQLRRLHRLARPTPALPSGHAPDAFASDAQPSSAGPWGGAPRALAGHGARCCGCRQAAARRHNRSQRAACAPLQVLSTRHPPPRRLRVAACALAGTRQAPALRAVFRGSPPMPAAEWGAPLRVGHHHRHQHPLRFAAHACALEYEVVTLPEHDQHAWARCEHDCRVVSRHGDGGDVSCHAQRGHLDPQAGPRYPNPRHYDGRCHWVVCCVMSPSVTGSHIECPPAGPEMAASCERGVSCYLPAAQSTHQPRVRTHRAILGDFVLRLGAVIVQRLQQHGGTALLSLQQLKLQPATQASALCSGTPYAVCDGVLTRSVCWRSGSSSPASSSSSFASSLLARSSTSSTSWRLECFSSNCSHTSLQRPKHT